MGRTFRTSLALLTLSALVAPAARADTRTDLEGAKRQLVALGNQITSQEGAVEAAQTRWKAIVGDVHGQEDVLAGVRAKLRDTTSTLTATQARLQTLRDRIGGRA